MGYVTLSNDSTSKVTLISNNFIDNYLVEANDAQLKIYLYLLRCMNSNENISVSLIADRFNYTEADVVRSLKHWEKKKVLSLSFNSEDELTCIQFKDLDKTRGKSEKATEKKANKVDTIVLKEETEVTFKEPKDTVKVVDFSRKDNYSAKDIEDFMKEPEIAQLLFIAETYLGKTLRQNEISSILFMYDSYNFSADLIEYLIEYCVNIKKTNIKYIETVAESWASTGITTVDEAKARTNNCFKEVYDVFNAFGIRGRSPIEPEISFVYKWLNNYGFPIEMIIEACNRTIMAIHSVSFEYADSILLNWKKAGAFTMEAVEELDRKHAQPRKKDSSSEDSKKTVRKNKTDKYDAKSQRKYDYAELERIALSR